MHDSNFLKLYGIPTLLALISIVLYTIFAYDLERSNFVKLITLYGALFFLAYYLIEISKCSFWLLVTFGLVFRFIFIGAIPNLSQDFYRFLWDGRLLLQGINPYLFTPEQLDAGASTALSLASIDSIANAKDLIDGMGALNASHFSNYPPVNQLFFAIAALFSKNSILGSVIVLRIIMIVADLGIIFFGRKLLVNLNLNPNTIFWYFLNPFIIIELTGNLHFEGVMLLFVVWSLYLIQKRKWFWAAVLLGISISIKLLPLLFLPLFFKWCYKNNSSIARPSIALRLTSVFLFYSTVFGVVLITFSPFLSSEFIRNFSETIGLWFQNFEFNASIYYVIRWIGYQTVGWNIIGTVGKILPLIVIMFLLYLSFFRKNASTKQLCTALLFGALIYFLLSTTVHPWYIATPLLLCMFTKYRFPIIWSAMVFLSYSAYGADGFSENLWLVALEYIVVISFAIWELFFKETTILQISPEDSRNI